jgi:hypothetical protein
VIAETTERGIMKNGSRRSKANQMYIAAHQEQYKNRDLPAALAIYREIIAAHPESKEAGYSRGQIRNIASKVVPQQELLDAQLDLALSHLALQS